MRLTGAKLESLVHRYVTHGDPDEVIGNGFGDERALIVRAVNQRRRRPLRMIVTHTRGFIAMLPPWFPYKWDVEVTFPERLVAFAFALDHERDIPRWRAQALWQQSATLPDHAATEG